MNPLQDAARFCHIILTQLREDAQMKSQLNHDLTRMVHSAQLDAHQTHRDVTHLALQIEQQIISEQRLQEAEIAARVKTRVMNVSIGKQKEAGGKTEELTELSHVPVGYRVYPKVNRLGAGHTLPRPVWELIITYLEEEQTIKMSLVCRLLYDITCPSCQFCTGSSGDARCHSLWREVGRRWPEVERKYPQANCVLIRRCVSQWRCKDGFDQALRCVREMGCAKGRHVLAENPNNPDYNICFWCRRGVKKSLQCPKSCGCSVSLCCSPSTSFHSSHTCTLCSASSPATLKSYRLLAKIRSSHPHLSINLNGKSHEHQLFQFPL